MASLHVKLKELVGYNFIVREDMLTLKLGSPSVGFFPNKPAY